MKQMTCKQLGGACDEVFEADTFEGMAELSKKHGMAMYQASDKAHLEAMKTMQTMMQSPDAMNQWMADKKKAFEALPEM